MKAYFQLMFSTCERRPRARLDKTFKYLETQVDVHRGF